MRLPRLVQIAAAMCVQVTLAHAQAAPVSIGTVSVRSQRGAPGIPPGETGIVSVYVVNNSQKILSNVEAEFSTGSQVKIIVPSSIGSSSVSQWKTSVPVVQPRDSVALVIRVFAPKRGQPDGSLPVWVSLRESGQMVLALTDLRLSNVGIRSTTVASVAAPMNAPNTLSRSSPSDARASTRALPEPPGLASAPARQFISDVDVNIPRARQARPDDIAVIIGNKNYRRAPEVTYAINDARSIREYAITALGFRPGNVVYVEDATLSDLKVLFGDAGAPSGRVADMVKPGRSEVWVFYSGHGAPDPTARKAYLMPTDADANRLALTGLSVDMLYQNLSRVGAAHVTVVIDACFSGASGGGQMLITAASPIGIQVNDPAELFAQSGGATIIAAASGQQLANWYEEQQHGLLTYFFLKGLQGSADFNRDLSISVSEIKQWLTDRVDGVPYEARRQHGREQTPQVWGSGERAIRP